MKKLVLAPIFAILLLHTLAISQSNSELVDACFMDVELTDYIVEVIQTGSSNINAVEDSEADQVNGILAEEGNLNLSVTNKLKAVLTACAEGRILQIKNEGVIYAE